MRGRNATRGCDIFFSRGGDRITDKQKKFADEYIKKPNATEAYMKAYGVKNRKYAANYASRMKNNEEINRYIKARQEEVARRAELDAQKVIELLAAIAFTSPADFASIESEGGKQKIVWKNVAMLPKEMRSAIGTVKNTPSGISVEMLDRLKAVSLLMKYMGIDEKGCGGVYIEGESEIEQ